MQTLIDRKTAQNRFNETIKTYNDWIYIIGNSNCGKSFFVKEITKNFNSIYCAPNHNFDYWKDFFKQIKNNANDIIVQISKFIDMDLHKNKFIGDLSNIDLEYLLETCIKNEVKDEHNRISKFLGTYLSKQYNYIILDNLYKCDIKSYKWLLSLLDAFSENEKCYIIAICDTDRNWIYPDLKEDLCGRFTKINVNKYDNSDAYYELINTIIHFNNEQILLDVSKKLYNDFQGSAQIILTLIKQLNREPDLKNLSDEDKEEIILKKAANLTLETVEKLNYHSKLLLTLLALSPVPLNLENIIKILEISRPVFDDAILECQNNDLIKSRIKGNTTEYSLTNFLTKEAYIKSTLKNQIEYMYEKLFRAYKTNILHLSDEDAVRLALKAKAEELNDISYSYFHGVSFCTDNMETLAELLNDFINVCDDLPKYLLNMTYVDILYRFGYYESAYKLINHIKINNDSFEYLMKKGDIEHLILHKNTAATFEKASKVNGITVSQKLSAINRQIMALTQEDKSKLAHARELYHHTIKKYANKECNGLIELYRNSNNIFPYKDALEYTIKGYNLAVKLDNDIEQIKNLHNICMLKLLNGNYWEDLNHPKLHIEPNFEMICKEFEKSNIFRHELAYPLLDLGTVDMFNYVKTNKKEYLLTAKKHYSRAQLYAKSFYAKNIAETSLLVVNSYLYRDDIEYVREMRKQIYNKYLNNKNNIKDFRVHRKILFSLTTSAIITNDTQEGKKYLLLSKQHTFEGETLRYNNFCDILGSPSEKKEYTPPCKSTLTLYNTTTKFVPWLISFGH